MKLLRSVLLLIITFYYFNSNAQHSDSLYSKTILKKAIIPATFIGVGVFLNGSRFEQNLQTDLRNMVGNDFEFRIDDYIQYAPAAEMYIADILGVKSKNHWFDQTKYLAISQIISASITHGLKYLTLKSRPNGAPYSFPSGHTTFAFTNAAVLYNEFSQTSPCLAYSGYVFSATTGTFRMINNKHWFSDVLVGAGIGILVTDLVYHFEPLKSFNPFKKTQNIAFVPQVSDKSQGFYFSYYF